MSNHLRLLAAVLSAFLLAIVSGCITPGKFNAGGTIPNPGSLHPGKATFTGLW